MAVSFIEQPEYGAAPAKVEAARRVWLPRMFSARLTWMNGNEVIKAWLLKISPGRCRLLSQEQVDASEALKTIAARIASPPLRDSAIEPFQAESSASAALTARLLLTTLSPTGKGWRLTLPRQALEECGAGGKVTETVVHLLFSDGYLEIWSAEHLNQALKAPLEQVIS